MVAAHQILSLTGINLQTKSVIVSCTVSGTLLTWRGLICCMFFCWQGFVELTLLPQKEFRHFYVNAKQSRIYKITLNDTLELQYQYFDPTLEVCLDTES